MEAGRPADVSVRDLVEEFQTLDVDEMGDANTNAGFSDTTLEQSIGGAQLNVLSMYPVRGMTWTRPASSISVCFRCLDAHIGPWYERYLSRR